MEQEVLSVINKLIREEHGNYVTMDSKLQDACIDSFGVTVLFLELDSKYGKFNNEWFKSVTNWVDEVDSDGTILVSGITIRDIVERALDESTKL